MRNSRGTIYCAGPLFTTKEREEMAELAAALEAAGYLTFLPQRDGLELRKCVDLLVDAGIPAHDAGHLISRAIFALDIYQVLYKCTALVANLNGRVPDEGTVSEAAMAWSRGKLVIGYKADSRTTFGGQDNPLLAGLFDFALCQSIEATVRALDNSLHQAHRCLDAQREREQEMRSYAKLGEAIASALERRESIEEIVDVIIQYERTTVLI